MIFKGGVSIYSDQYAISIQSCYKVEKNWIKISSEDAYLHIMSFITTKFQEILLSGFRGVALTKCFSSIFHFGQISKFKKGVILRKKNWIKISCGYAHLHIMTFITIKFQEILMSGFSRVALTNCFNSIFHFGQISKFKKGITPWKKIESKFPVDMRIYILCPS